MPRFIITCDDCGLSEGINQAALALHQQGMATTASLMVNFPATAHAIDLFAPYTALEVGAHLNLTEGSSLTSAPELTASDGRFHNPYVLFWKALFPRAAFLNAVEAELSAQIDATPASDRLSNHGILLYEIKHSESEPAPLTRPRNRRRAAT